MADANAEMDAAEIDRLLGIDGAPDYMEGDDPAPIARSKPQGPASPTAAIERLLWLVMMTSANPPVTELMPPKNGLYWGANMAYQKLFSNDTPREIRVQVFCEFGVPGEGVKLALNSNSNDTGKVDELAATANGKSESVGIILRSGETLWAAPYGGVPMTAGTVVRARVFDPQSFSVAV